MLEIWDICIPKLNKGRYISCYMSDSQYISGGNIEIYVHIVASWLQLIYILWVFYVRILSICHKFIESSISGGLIPCNVFYCLQGNNHNRVDPIFTNSHCVNPYQLILAVCKATISRELYQGALRPIGLIPRIFITFFKAIISRESPQGALSTTGLIPINLF